MRDIRIKNFRCYEDKYMEFKRGINLLIGDNSSGKTSLLHACNLVINSFFAGFSDDNTAWKSADDSDFRYTGIDEQPIEISFHNANWDFNPIIVNNLTEQNLSPDIELKLQKNSKKNSRNLVGGIKPLKDYAQVLQKFSHSVGDDGTIVQNNTLPVYACFTTEDIHTVRKFDKNKFKNLKQKPSFGYYECFDCKGLFECWLKRLLVLKEAHTGEDEIDTVRNAISEALGENGCNIISDIDIRVNDGSVYFVLTDGRTVESALLSDGHRRLVNIVIDIAMRCALLNKVMFGADCYKHSHGTVIIDEIDEHLHPALQVRILRALQDTFPEIQFIISTHSPLVMSSLTPKFDETGENINVVYKLEYTGGRYEHKELHTYGMDASTIIESAMGQPARDISIDDKYKNIARLIDESNIAEARKEIEDVRNIVTDGDPELTRLEALLSFIE